MPVTSRIYTPNVVAKIRSMAPTYTSDQIAADIGASVSGLRTFCGYAGIRLKAGTPKRRFMATLSKEASTKFRSAAHDRDLDGDEFVRMILETIAADDMIDAVMADDVFEKKSAKTG